MLNNKFVLSAFSRRKNDGIFMITVGESSNDMVNTVTKCLDTKNPNKIFCTNDEYFLHNNDFSLKDTFIGVNEINLKFQEIHQPNHQDCYVYIHIKKDLGIVSKHFYFDLNRSQSIAEDQGADSNLHLFEPTDKGKTFRVYIGSIETPPPWL